MELSEHIHELVEHSYNFFHLTPSGPKVNTCFFEATLPSDADPKKAARVLDTQIAGASTARRTLSLKTNPF